MAAAGAQTAQPPPHPPTTPASRVSTGTSTSALRTNQVKNLNFTKYAFKKKKEEEKKRKKGKSNWELSDRMAPFAQPIQHPARHLTGPKRLGKGTGQGEATNGPCSKEMPLAQLLPSPHVSSLSQGPSGAQGPGALAQSQPSGTARLVLPIRLIARARREDRATCSTLAKPHPGRGSLPGSSCGRAGGAVEWELHPQPPNQWGTCCTSSRAPRPSLPQPGRNLSSRSQPWEESHRPVQHKIHPSRQGCSAREYFASWLLFNQRKEREIFIVSECIKVTLGFVRDMDITKHFIRSLPTSLK